LMTIGQRIAECRERRGWSQKKLGELLSVARTTVASWEQGTRSPGKDDLRRLADVFNVSIDYLCGRVDGPGYIAQEIKAPEIPPGAWPVISVVRVPILGAIRAGEPVLAEENILGWEEVPADTVRDGDYFFLRVKGDSMIGARIADGDLVLVRQQPIVDDGQIAVVMVGAEEAVLKRVHHVNGQLILTSENSDYPPMLVQNGDARIIGKVMWVRVEPK
jgi:repressor LexA